MSVEIIANVEEDYAGGWFIRLTDTEDGSSQICETLDIFSEKIADIGVNHNNDIVVKWSKNSDVTNEHFYELHQQMAIFQESFKEN
ncbi:MAG: hypothetical protein L0Y61_05335 [Epsilonproteobacteria bacterium]|nr:hypothetical protein [Campylobacterota bacterium]